MLKISGSASEAPEDVHEIIAQDLTWRTSTHIESCFRSASSFPDCPKFSVALLEPPDVQDGHSVSWVDFPVDFPNVETNFVCRDI